MKLYKAKHRCRLCGERFIGSCATGNRDLAFQYILSITANLPFKEVQTPTEIHFCKDGSIGRADFEGWVYEDD